MEQIELKRAIIRHAPGFLFSAETDGHMIHRPGKIADKIAKTGDTKICVELFDNQDSTLELDLLKTQIDQLNPNFKTTMDRLDLLENKMDTKTYQGIKEELLIACSYLNEVCADPECEADLCHEDDIKCKKCEFSFCEEHKPSGKCDSCIKIEEVDKNTPRRSKRNRGKTAMIPNAGPEVQSLLLTPSPPKKSPLPAKNQKSPSKKSPSSSKNQNSPSKKSPSQPKKSSPSKKQNPPAKKSPSPAKKSNSLKRKQIAADKCVKCIKAACIKFEDEKILLKRIFNLCKR